MTPTTEDDGRETREKQQIRLDIPPRFFLVPGAAVIVGVAIGLTRGGRATSLRFLAENVHRPPTTVQGWYFYNKTKNYKVMLGALKGAGKEAGKLGVVGLGWVGMEEGLQRSGWGSVSSVGAAVGTAGLFSAVYRLPWKTAQRTVVLGLIMGGSLEALTWGRARLEAKAAELREAETEEAMQESSAGLSRRAA